MLFGLWSKARIDWSSVLGRAAMFSVLSWACFWIWWSCHLNTFQLCVIDCVCTCMCAYELILCFSSAVSDFRDRVSCWTWSSLLTCSSKTRPVRPLWTSCLCLLVLRLNNPLSTNHSNSGPHCWTASIRSTCPPPQSNTLIRNFLCRDSVFIKAVHSSTKISGYDALNCTMYHFYICFSF